jgi:hypothetical protein
MIKYALRCEAAHEFESWFTDSASFDMQVKRGFVTCPVCQSARVTKQIMAPRIARSGGKAAEPAPVAAPGPPAVVEAVFDAQAGAMREMARAFASFVTAHTEDVGKAFAEESRKIHHGEADERPIRGQASIEDVRELLEEGIRVLPIPILPEDRN